MNNIIKVFENKIYENKNITLDEALELSKSENLQELLQAADRICKRYSKNKVYLCSIMNAKSGKCSEDCKYCAQSCHYNTGVLEYPLVDKSEALKLAVENESFNVNRFSLVTSGKTILGQEFEKILEIYDHIYSNSNIGLCASLGILSLEQLIKLKKFGVTRYHHNLETSRDYYSTICSTHTYDDRINTILSAKKAGLEICSGGIIGMGETMEDRIKMAIELQNLEVKSIPINILTPIKGTPLENLRPLNESEILKTIALFKFINPSSSIRLAGGRNFLNEFGKNAFTSGVNAAITGNYLTTSGNNISDDIKMLNSMALEVNKND